MNDYDDILFLPHHRSANRPHMTASERAAQFAPFASLKGYDEEIREASREPCAPPEEDESRSGAINDALVALKRREREHPSARVVFFRGGDGNGEFRTVEGPIERIEEERQRLRLGSGEWIRFEEILDLIPL